MGLMVSLYSLLSSLKTQIRGKMRESGKIVVDLCPFLSTLTLTLKPRRSLPVPGNYVTFFTSLS